MFCTVTPWTHPSISWIPPPSHHPLWYSRKRALFSVGSNQASRNGGVYSTEEASKKKKAQSKTRAVGVSAQETASLPSSAQHRRAWARVPLSALCHTKALRDKDHCVGETCLCRSAYVMQQYALVRANNQPSVCLHTHLIPASWKTCSSFIHLLSWIIINEPEKNQIWG